MNRPTSVPTIVTNGILPPFRSFGQLQRISVHDFQKGTACRTAHRSEKANGLGLNPDACFAGRTNCLRHFVVLKLRFLQPRRFPVLSDHLFSQSAIQPISHSLHPAGRYGEIPSISMKLSVTLHSGHLAVRTPSPQRRSYFFPFFFVVFLLPGFFATAPAPPFLATRSVLRYQH